MVKIAHVFERAQWYGARGGSETTRFTPCALRERSETGTWLLEERRRERMQAAPERAPCSRDCGVGARVSAVQNIKKAPLHALRTHGGRMEAEWWL